MLGWLFRKPRFYRYPDTLGFRQEKINDAVRQAIDSRLAAGDTVILVCHFPQCFETYERLISEWNFEFEIPTSRIGSTDLDALAPSEKGLLILTLSQMLEPSNDLVTRLENGRQLSMLVVEKNPVPLWDQQVEQFARTSTFPAKLGYYLSFEQPLMDYCFGSHERNLLKNWSSVGNEVFSSTLASRRVSAKIRSQFQAIADPQPADSIEEWLRINVDSEE